MYQGDRSSFATDKDMRDEDAVIFIDEHNKNLKNKLNQTAGQRARASNTTVKDKFSGEYTQEKRKRGRPAGIARDSSYKTDPLHSEGASTAQKQEGGDNLRLLVCY